MGKMDSLKIGLSLVSKIEPILKEIVQIKGKQTHGKQELIATDEKFVATYREYFEREEDAEHFVKFANHVYAMQKGQLPPIHTLTILFKMLLPIMMPKELKGNQSHGRPEIKKTDDGKYAVVLKEVFSQKEDCISHLQEAEKIKSMRI